MIEANRYIEGLTTMYAVFGEASIEMRSALESLSPDLARLYVEIPFSDIYSRSALSLKTRELLAVAALTCLGGCDNQLSSHVHAAKAAGCTEEEIKEAVLAMVLFAGFPRTINGMTVVAHALKQ